MAAPTTQQGADPGQPAAGLDALGQEIISAACLAYGVRGNGDKAPMIALDDAVCAYMAAPSPVPAAPAGLVDADTVEGLLWDLLSALHHLDGADEPEAEAKAKVRKLAEWLAHPGSASTGPTEEKAQ